MENASKALIMAGAILLALAIISLSVLIFRNMSGAVDRNANMDKQKITAFNERIYPYVGENISASQVNELKQIVRAINLKADNEQDDQRKINLSVNADIKIGTYYKVTATQNKYGYLTTIIVDNQ